MPANGGGKPQIPGQMKHPNLCCDSTSNSRNAPSQDPAATPQTPELRLGIALYWTRTREIIRRVQKATKKRKKKKKKKKKKE
ncbi:hypothetical protein LTR39_006450, partial [Cryomyces antarcticus]